MIVIGAQVVTNTYGSGSSNVFPHEVHCDGSELRLSDCPNTNGCSSSAQAAVQCLPGKCKHLTVCIKAYYYSK